MRFFRWQDWSQWMNEMGWNQAEVLHKIIQAFSKDSCLAILKDNLPQTNLPIILQMAQFLLPVGPQAVRFNTGQTTPIPILLCSLHVNYGITATWWFISMFEKRRYWKRRKKKNQTHFLKGQTVRIHLLPWSIWHRARAENTKWRIWNPDALCASQFGVKSFVQLKVGFCSTNNTGGQQKKALAWTSFSLQSNHVWCCLRHRCLASWRNIKPKSGLWCWD